MRWDEFTSQLTSTDIFIPEKLTDKKIEKLLKKIYSAIDAAVEDNCPTVPAFSRKVNNKWFNGNLSEQESKLKKYYAQAMSSKNPTDHKKYRRAHNRYKRNCRFFRREG